MDKRIFAGVLAAGLLASALVVGPATAQDAPVIPDTVQIDDPVGDANGVNDQDNAYDTPAEGEGDHVGPAGGTATDIRKVWFSHTATEVSLNIQVNGDPSALAYDTYFRFSSNAGEGPVANDVTRGCLQWIASVNGSAGAYNGPTEGNLTDKCNVGTPVFGPLVISQASEGYVITVTFPRSYSPLLADGSKLTAPFGVSRILYANGLPSSPATGNTAAFVTLDNTKRGADYDLVAAGPTEPGTPEPPKPTKPTKPVKPGKGKAKGCDKGQGKKKGCKPAPPAACATYTPGELGKDKPTVVVTDAATEAAPLEQKVTLAQSFANYGVVPAGPFVLSSDFFNVQVDSANPEAGLYVYLEFPERRDYDIDLLYPDNSYAARSHDGNTLLGTGEGENGGHAGESTTSSEKIVGVRTADCGGYTVEASNWFGEGGEFTVQLWLGEIKNDPLAPGEEPRG